MNSFLAYITLADGTARDEVIWATTESQARDEVEYLYKGTDVFGIAISQYEAAE
jgi:hypothetical protein